MVYPKNIDDAIKEICKIETDVSIIRGIASRAVYLCIHIEDVPYYVTSMLKQEMANCGGEVIVQKDLLMDSLENTNAFIMGNLAQINEMLARLGSHSEVSSEIISKIQLVIQSVDEKKTTYYCCRGHKFEIGKKTYLMGILNITADSFSGDGLLSGGPSAPFKETINQQVRGINIGDSEAIIEAACRRAETMVANGADIIDVGGESTRPGYRVIDDREELDRILSVVERLVKTLNVPISVDTSKLYVVENVLSAGAHIINDVSGLIKEPQIAKLAASYGAGVIAMHNPDRSIEGDLLGQIIKTLRKSVDIAISAGLKQENIILDPGIGFGVTLEQNLEIVRRLDELKCLGYPVLLGTSRKSMIGKVLGLPVNERVEGTAATVALGIAKGVDFVRVHDVGEMYRVVKMSDAIVRDRYG
ncbi:MAG: dihydropteroate synthase [Nitrososphaerota archaeon]|nr:dihydropteroate synthase [Nitrososphaerota archaeon]